MASVSVQLTGLGWERFRQRLQQLQIGAEEMARTRFLVGSSLPYASHWIEEGWRNDPRYGRVTIQYRKPEATYFMRASAQAFGARFGARRPSGREPIGGMLGAQLMLAYADDIAESMRQILNAEVYSAPVPTRNGRPRWQRIHTLYNSIKVFRA